MSISGFFKKSLLASAFFTSFFTLNSSAIDPHPAKDESVHGEETFNFKETLFHHLLDAYAIEFYKNSEGKDVKIELPRILYNTHSGNLDFFGSTTAAIEAGYVEKHHLDHDAKHGDLLAPEVAEKMHHLEAQAAHASGEEQEALEKERHELASEYAVLDFSITKNVFFMMIATILLLIIFISVANAYKKNPDSAPKGVQSFFEPIIEFIRNDIAKENIAHGYERYMPLLLTMFFFIWFLNMMGLIPFSGNVTGNISVTLTLAVVTLVVVNFSGKKGYWKHILWPPVPHGVKIILIPVEIVGILTKPFALTVRLFANMTAGHVIIISLISMIFIFGKMGQAAATGYTVGFFSTAFLIAIGLLEVFVALLQAYVFTLLTAVFIGQAVEEEHH